MRTVITRGHWILDGIGVGRPVFPSGVIGPSRTVSHEMLNPKRLCCGTDRVTILDHEIGKARDVIRNWIIPLELALFMQRHHRHDGDGLGHGEGEGDGDGGDGDGLGIGKADNDGKGKGECGG